MISSISQVGGWVEVRLVNNYVPLVSPSPNPMHGAVRIINGQQEIFNGEHWEKNRGQVVQIGITNRTEAVLAWAEGKMLQEAKAQEMARTKPAVADALDAVARAEEQLKLILLLTEQSR
jgi:glycerol kinase